MQIMMLGTNPLLRLGVTFSITATSTDTVHVWNTTKNALKSFGMADYTDGDTVCSVNEVGGTSRRNITVGSYYNNLIFHLWNGRTKADMAEVNHSITLYTGVGPTIDGRNKPDIVAPGSNVVGSLSRMASATGGDSDIVIWPNPPDPIGRYACTGGTSIASPIAAGIVALMLQAKPDLLPDSAKAILQRTAIRDQWSGKLANWSSRWGAGKVNALGAIQAVLGMPVTGAGTYRVPAVLNYAFDAHNRIIRIVRSGDRDAGASRCLLYTMNGRLLMSVSLKDKSEFILPLKITRGTYLLVLKSGSVQCVRRISVQK